MFHLKLHQNAQQSYFCIIASSCGGGGVGGGVSTGDEEYHGNLWKSYLHWSTRVKFETTMIVVTVVTSKILWQKIGLQEKLWKKTNVPTKKLWHKNQIVLKTLTKRCDYIKE